ncbi:MAG: LPXTG cell wall anchor domain-containing protein, partial [Coprobacillus sp.]|nr:LPXTG cell wall anchor domain-containing protein [Coprobacillus sp.]
DGKADINIDTNGDGKPDINIDVNGDYIADKNIVKTSDDTSLMIPMVVGVISLVAIIWLIGKNKRKK